MPIPLIAAAVAAVATLLAGGAVAYALRDKTEGKTLAILGARRTGKTTLTRYIAEGVLGSEYKETLVSDVYKGRTVQLDGSRVLHVADLKDVSGDRDSWAEWERRVKQSDVVLYLMRSSWLREREPAHLERCRRDLQQIEAWLSEEPEENRPQVQAIISFCDQDSEWQSVDPAERQGSYVRSLLDGAALRPTLNMIQKHTDVRYTTGHLADETAAEELLRRVAEAMRT